MFINQSTFLYTNFNLIVIELVSIITLRFIKSVNQYFKNINYRIISIYLLIQLFLFMFNYDNLNKIQLPSFMNNMSFIVLTKKF